MPRLPGAFATPAAEVERMSNTPLPPQQRVERIKVSKEGSINYNALRRS
jgi:hypothetical protein